MTQPKLKLGILGTGKTGGFVKELAVDFDIVEFNSKNRLDLDTARKLDVLIAFVSAEVFSEYVDTMIEARLKVVSGATGELAFENINKKLTENNLSWIWASNFSLGMTLVKRAMHSLAKMLELDSGTSFNIHEIHHTKKLDSPSGTAKSWNEWIGNIADISAERIGDEIGFHELKVENEFEKIMISHQSKNRALFAKGSLWAAKYLLNNKTNPGLHKFEDIIDQSLG